MAPRSKKKDSLLLEAINLSRSTNAISSMEGLVKLRDSYLLWRVTAKKQIASSTQIPEEKKLAFLQNDPVEADFWQNGGARMTYPSERTKDVLQKITSATIKWIDFLSDFDLRGPTPASYDKKTKTLFLAHKTVKISERAENYPALLLRTLFKKPKHSWAVDEIMYDWYKDDIGSNNTEDRVFRRIYQAGIEVNSKIAKRTGIADFLIVKMKEVSINKGYL